MFAAQINIVFLLIRLALKSLGIKYGICPCHKTGSNTRVSKDICSMNISCIFADSLQKRVKIFLSKRKEPKYIALYYYS